MGESREPGAGAREAGVYAGVEPPRVWDIRVDFNTYPGPDLVYGNARHARAGVDVHVGAPNAVPALRRRRYVAVAVGIEGPWRTTYGASTTPTEGHSK